MYVVFHIASGGRKLAVASRTFTSREAAEEFAAGLRATHPGLRAWVRHFDDPRLDDLSDLQKGFKHAPR